MLSHGSSLACRDRQCPHVRWRDLLLLPFALILSLFLANCGAPASSAPASAFLYTDMLKVEYLTWHTSGGNGQVTGQWYVVSYQPPLSASSSPSVATFRVSGSQENQSITLTGADASLSGEVGQQMLQVSVPDDSGQLVTQTWVPASQQDYAHLVAEFRVFQSLRGTLNDLARLLTGLPVDSNPYSLDASVTQASSYIDLLQAKLVSMQGASSHINACQQAFSFKQYYPIDPSTTFRLPYAPVQSTLARDLSAIQSLWKQAQALPPVPGLPTPWRITPSELVGATAAGQGEYTALQATYARDTREMSHLMQQYQRIGAAFTAIEQGC